MIETVAIVAPGDMGHSVGAVLRHHGMRVITNLEGRSGRSREFAQVAGFEDVGNDAALVAEADVLLSILVPARGTNRLIRSSSWPRGRFTASQRCPRVNAPSRSSVTAR